MKGIISLQIGNCGNQIGTKFYETISAEHGLDNSGKYTGTSDKYDPEMIQVYFRETLRVEGYQNAPGEGTGVFRARAIVADLDPATIDFVRSSPNGLQYDESNMVKGQSGTDNNFAKGHYTTGPEILQPVMQAVRSEFEQSGFAQGFQITHSLGGGTGSGFGTRVIRELDDTYPTKMVSSFAVLPGKMMTQEVEAFNAALALKKMSDSSCVTISLDNEALFNISKNSLGITDPNHADLNHLIASTMSGVTASMRLHGSMELHSHLRRLATNMVPFRRLKFLVAGIAPVTKRGGAQHAAVSGADLTEQVFNAANMTAACDPTRGKYLSVAAMFRGPVSEQEVLERMSNVQTTSPKVEWIPRNVKTAFYSTPAKGFDTSATILANNTAIKTVLKRLSDQFDNLVGRKAYFHLYTSEGMDESEIFDAQKNLKDLIAEYEKYQTI